MLGSAHVPCSASTPGDWAGRAAPCPAEVGEHSWCYPPGARGEAGNKCHFKEKPPSTRAKMRVISSLERRFAVKHPAALPAGEGTREHKREATRHLLGPDRPGLPLCPPSPKVAIHSSSKGETTPGRQKGCVVAGLWQADFLLRPANPAEKSSGAWGLNYAPSPGNVLQSKWAARCAGPGPPGQASGGDRSLYLLSLSSHSPQGRLR